MPREWVTKYVSLVNADDNFVIVLDARDMLGLLLHGYSSKHDFDFQSALESIKAQAIEQARAEDEEDLLADLCAYISWLDE